jgi:hypothetical protein
MSFESRRSWRPSSVWHPMVLLLHFWLSKGAEATNLIIAEKSAGVPRREPSVGHNDRARRAQSEATYSASPNQYLAENDAHRHIT